jgi:tetratricopeptide (TPR) repeat protein
MTSRRKLALLLALSLAGCDGREPEVPGSDWREMLARGDGLGAEVALRRELDAGAQREALAPFFGEAELLQGDLIAASSWLDLAPFTPDVAAQGFRMIGRLKMREGELRVAGQAFDRALALRPADPEVWADIGRLRWQGGEQAQAIEASKKALALGPANPQAILLRAQLIRDAQGNAAALPLLERGLTSAPEHTELLGEYAATLGELGRAKDMLAAVRKLPAGPRGLYLQAVLAARGGKYDTARDLLQRSGDLHRQLPAAVLLLALIDLESGNVESAAQGLERLLRRQPDNRRARLLLARALAMGGNHRELIGRFGQDTASPYLATLVGRAHEALGERQKAAPYLDRASSARLASLERLAPSTAVDVAQGRGTSNGSSVVALVRGLIAQDRAGEARAKAQAFLEAHPGSGDAMALAGDAAIAARDLGGGLALYRKAAAIRRPWSLTKRIVAALDLLGRPGEGTALIKAHLAGEPGNAEAFAWLRVRSTG